MPSETGEGVRAMKEMDRTMADTGYKIDARTSRFTVQAIATGVLSAFGHNPTIAVNDMAGEIHFDPDAPQSSSLHLTIPTASLEVQGEFSTLERREIEKAMRRDVLETGRYTEIVYDSTQVVAEPAGDGQYRLTLQGTLSLHGVTRSQTIPARMTRMGDMLRTNGEFTLRQTDYNIRLVSFAGGALKLKDELKFSFDIVARRQP